MLDVDGRHHVDAGVQQFQHIFVALAVLAARHVGVRKLVDDHRVWMAREDGVDVHLFELDAAIGNHALRNDLQVANLLGGLFAAMGLNHADHHISALFALQQWRR